MGSNFSCTPEDDEMYSIHEAAAPLFAQSSLRVVSADTLRAAEEVYIPLQFTPSPSPMLGKPRARAKSRLPKQIKKLKLESIVSGESWDSFGQGNSQCRNLRQLAGAKTFVREETITRCVSDRQSYRRVRSSDKRASVPVQLLQKQLAQFEVSAQPRTSLPLFLDFPRVSRERSEMYSEMDSPMSEDIWLMESTRSRPGWASVSAPSQEGGSESNFGSFGSFKGTLRDDNTMRRRIGEILCHSDSQFYVPAPVLTPIFSNKVRTFADEDEERFSMIVNALEQKFHTLNHHTSSSCDSGSPSVSRLLIGGTAFPSTPGHSSNSGSAFPLNPVLKKVLSHGKTLPPTPVLKKPLSNSSGSGFPENPVLKKVLSSSSVGNQSIGGGAFPQTPTHDARWITSFDDFERKCLRQGGKLRPPLNERESLLRRFKTPQNS